MKAKLNKKEYLDLFKNNSGAISYMILYCSLLVNDDDISFYYAILMSLCTKICTLSYIHCEEEVKEKDYRKCLKLINNNSQIKNFLDTPDLINWKIENLSRNKTEKYYQGIYNCVITYLCKLFCQKRFKEDHLATYPLSCALNTIYKSKGKLPQLKTNDFSGKNGFTEYWESFNDYCPLEWKNIFIIPDGFDQDDFFNVDRSTKNFEYLISEKKK